MNADTRSKLMAWLETSPWWKDLPYADLKAKLEAMERMRLLIDEFQQEAQTRWKDYAPEQINQWLIRIKTAAQEEE